MTTTCNHGRRVGGVRKQPLLIHETSPPTLTHRPTCRSQLCTTHDSVFSEVSKGFFLFPFMIAGLQSDLHATVGRVYVSITHQANVEMEN